MDAFRVIEPPDVSERNKPANSVPSIGAVGAPAESTTRPSRKIELKQQK
jgi:hypothetical protein